MNNTARTSPLVSSKLVACAVIAGLVILGVVGIVLPLLPGLLFLLLAAVVLARHFPVTKRWLRSNGAWREHFDRADGVLDLPLAAQIKLGALLCAKAALEAARLAGTLLTRLVAVVTR